MNDEVEKIKKIAELYREIEKLAPDSVMQLIIHGMSEMAALRAGFIDKSFIAGNDGNKYVIKLYSLEDKHATLKIFVE